MLNALHLLSFWEAQESRQSTRQGEQKDPMIKAVSTNLMVGKVVC